MVRFCVLERSKDKNGGVSNICNLNYLLSSHAWTTPKQVELWVI